MFWQRMIIRAAYEQIERIRHLRPDMILLSGGIDGGTTKHVAELAEIIGAADHDQDWVFLQITRNLCWK